MKPQLTPYAKGLLITALGVLIISPDGLFTRLIDADVWTYAFWRGLLSGIAILVGMFVIYGRQGWSRLRSVGWPGLLIAIVFGMGSTMFVYAFTTTTIANTLFIVNTQPVFAALIGWFFLQDRVPPRTVITICVVLVGIAIIAFADGTSAGNLWGNLAALAAALSTAIALSLTRHFRSIDMVPAVGLAGFVSALLSFPLAQPAIITGEQWPYLLFLALFILPVSFTLMYIGPRYVPAAEVTLMMLLEAILGPLYVWWVFSETPGIYTWIGGMIIITALAANAAIPLLKPARTVDPQQRPA